MTVSTPEPRPDAARAVPSGPPGRRRLLRRSGLLAALVALPVAAGITGYSVARTSPAVIPATPVPIARLAPDTAASIRGRVAEVFGNKVVLQDDSGRALVELGRRGEGGTLVASGDTVTVQGRFDDGSLKASALIRQDGRVETLGPAGRPPGGPMGWARDKIGAAARPDVPAITAALTGAGFTDIRVLGSGPRHLEVAARDAAGRDQRLHVGFDGRIRDIRPLG